MSHYPIVAKWCWQGTEDVIPRADGSYTAQMLEVLQFIKENYKMSSYADPVWPFVLRKFSPARYKANEADRLSKVRGMKTNLLTTLDVNERNGDRILLVMRLAEHSVSRL